MAAVVRQWRETGQRKRDKDDDVEKGIGDDEKKRVMWQLLHEVS